MAKRRDREFPDSFEGAVDIVFLLIIFFLVASSFNTEIKQKIALPKREKNQEKQTPPPEKQDPIEVQNLRIVIYESAEMRFNKTPVDLGEPNSIEVYYKVTEKIQEMIKEAKDAGMVDEESGRPRLNVQLWSDKRAYTGMTLHALMAALDAEFTPEVQFDKELDPTKDM